MKKRIDNIKVKMVNKSKLQNRAMFEKFNFEEDHQCPDIRFNGNTFFYNPLIVESLTDGQIIKLIDKQIQIFFKAIPFIHFIETYAQKKGLPDYLVREYEENEYKWPTKEQILENPSIAEPWFRFEKLYETEIGFAADVQYLTLIGYNQYLKASYATGVVDDVYYYAKEKDGSFRRIMSNNKLAIGLELGYVAKFEDEFTLKVNQYKELMELVDSLVVDATMLGHEVRKNYNYGLHKLYVHLGSCILEAEFDDSVSYIENVVFSKIQRRYASLRDGDSYIQIAEKAKELLTQ